MGDASGGDGEGVCVVCGVDDGGEDDVCGVGISEPADADGGFWWGVGWGVVGCPVDVAGLCVYPINDHWVCDELFQ